MLWYRNWATRSPCASLRYSSVSRPGRTCGIAAACRSDKETEELQPLEWDKPWPWPHLFAKVLSHVFGIQDLKCGHVGKPPGHDVVMSIWKFKYDVQKHIPSHSLKAQSMESKNSLPSGLALISALQQQCRATMQSAPYSSAERKTVSIWMLFVKVTRQHPIHLTSFVSVLEKKRQSHAQWVKINCL